ncbi:MAG: histone deacetylase family protein [Bacillota bacterium]
MRRTGLVYHPDYLLHAPDNWPECPQRLTRTLELFDRVGIRGQMIHVQPRPATTEELAAVHTEDYIAFLERYSADGGGQMTIDTMVSAGSFTAALLAAGGCLSAIDELLAGRLDNALALVRPPGHHAERPVGTGFCLFNNVAVAARYAQRRHGLSRILIVDWDVHHGNGTERTFYDDPGVLFFSVHESPAYPGTGWLSDVGAGDGEGYTVNAPFPAGAGDQAYLRLFDEVLLPVADRYKPELILVSAGQDSHFADYMGNMELTSPGFGRLTGRLTKSEPGPGPKILAVLEGGYNLDVLPSSLLAIAGALIGGDYPSTDPVPAPVDVISETVRQRLAAVRTTQRPYWPFL